MRLPLFRQSISIPCSCDTLPTSSTALVIALWVAIAWSRPYFSSIRSHFTVIEPNHVELVIPKRRRVHNHLKTVHAIALCNGLEAAMGALAEVSIPRDKRWIPKGMEVSYTAKATSDITCFAETEADQWTSDDPDLPVRVWATREDGERVIEGVIKLWVTPKATR